MCLFWLLVVAFTAMGYGNKEPPMATAVYLVGAAVERTPDKSKNDEPDCCEKERGKARHIEFRRLPDLAAKASSSV